MGLPDVKINYIPSDVTALAEDFANIPMVIGPSSAGQDNVPVTITTLSDLGQLGYGPAVDLAANDLVKSGKTLYFCKSATTTAGTIGSISKVLGNPIGTPVTIGAGNASMIFTAKLVGQSVTITQRVGNTLATTATLVAGLLTINLGTDGGGTPNATPNDVKTVLDGVAGVSSAMTYVPGGTGLGIMQAAGNTVLPFGSTGAATSSGTSNNNYTITVKCTKAGTIGANPSPYVIWSYDGSTNYNFDTLIPSTGVLPIKDSRCDSSVILTFTGALDVGDTFTFTTTAPKSSVSAITTAMQAGIADSTRLFGHFQIVASMSRNDAVAIDAILQGVKGTKFLQGMIHTRDQAEGVANETTAAYQAALSADFAGFLSVSGPLSVCAGAISVQSQLTLLIHRVPHLFGEGPNRANADVHESIGDKPLAFLAVNPIDGKQIYYDDNVTPGLDTQRFIVPRSFKSKPGVYRSNRGWTMSDPNLLGYDRTDYVNMIFSSAKIVNDVVFDELMNKASAIPKPQGGAPAGAIEVTYAKKIESKCKSALRNFWLRPKKDGDASAVDIENPVIVLRNYSFAATRELRLVGAVQPRTTIESIVYNQTVSIPQ